MCEMAGARDNLFVHKYTQHTTGHDVAGRSSLVINEEIKLAYALVDTHIPIDSSHVIVIISMSGFGYM